MVVNSASTLMQRIQLAKKCMALLLKTMLLFPQATFERRMKGIYNSHSVNGPLAVSWGLRVMSWKAAPGTDRDFFLSQMEKCDRDAATMKRIQNGWEKFGMTPDEVINHVPARQIARYNSEPCFRSWRAR